MLTIAIDAMGGDHGPSVTVPSSIEVLRTCPDVHFIFVGLEPELRQALKKHGAGLASRWSVQHASEIVGSDESPAVALRSKKDSSMRVAINLVKEGRAQACVSAGNTGALMATARFVLKMLPGIDRPAIVGCLPTMNPKRSLYMLDLGANVDSSPEQLYQFAVMASALVSAVEGVESPSVALFNIGEEEIKGNELVKQAAEIFGKSDTINFQGYVEGNNLFVGGVDVVVCDGFVGNAVIKTAEGIIKLVADVVKRTVKQSWLTRLLFIPAIPFIKKVASKIDPRHRNGATLLGLNGVVVKSHGRAGPIAFNSALREAILEAEKNVPERIRHDVQDILNRDSAASMENAE